MTGLASVLRSAIPVGLPNWLRFLPSGSPAVSRIIVYCGLIGALGVALAIAIHASERWQRLVEPAGTEVRNTAWFLAEHAARLFEVSDLALQKVDTLTTGSDWDTIERSSALQQRLAELRDTLPYVGDIWLSDPNGKLRLTSHTFPTPVSNAAESDAFRAQLKRDQGLAFGAPIVGRLTDERTFLVSRRLENLDGSLRGVVFATLSLDYFLRFWKSVPLPPGSHVVVFRADDHAVLSQYPSLLADGRGVDLALAQAIEASPRAGQYWSDHGGFQVKGAFARIGELPLYLRVTLAQEAVLRDFVRDIAPALAFGLAAIGSLIGLTWLAWRQARRDEVASARLGAEVARQTAALREETRTLDMLNRVSLKLAEQRDSDAVLALVADKARKLASATSCRLIRGDDGRLDPAIVADGAPKGHCAQASTVVLDDLTTEAAALLGEEEAERLRHEGVRSVLVVPIVSRSGALHATILLGHTEVGHFRDRHQDLLANLAGQAATAIDNTLLLAAAEREIAARRATEEQHRLLIRELNHRVKNTLATIKAVASLSARSAVDVNTFVRGFAARLSALAQTHTLLADGPSQSASVRHLLEAELSPYGQRSRASVRLHGPTVMLSSDQAVPFSMAIHELATNAAKYGALSSETGRVDVEWRQETARPERTALEVVWRESGGPPVEPPSREGFGSTLLNRVLREQLKAEVIADYAPAGLVLSLRFVLPENPGAEAPAVSAPSSSASPVLG